MKYSLLAIIFLALITTSCSSEEGKIEKAYECCKRMCDMSIERTVKVGSLGDPDLDRMIKEEEEKMDRGFRIECYSLCKEGKKRCLDTLKTEPELWKDVWKNHCDKMVGSWWKDHKRFELLDVSDEDFSIKEVVEKDRKQTEDECYSCCD